MFNINLDEIDIYNIGSWPNFLKILVTIIIGFLLIFIIKWLFIDSKVEELDGLLAEEKRLKSFFINKQKLLVNIDEYKGQLVTIEKRLTNLVQMLPGANEVPALVNQISQAGRETGLNFKEIAILPEKKFKYYVELPIKIKVHGNYHQLGEFISRLTDLPRIITLHDFNLEVSKDKSSQKTVSESLDLEILAKTYRYLAQEISDESKIKKNNKLHKNTKDNEAQSDEAADVKPEKDKIDLDVSINDDQKALDELSEVEENLDVEYSLQKAGEDNA